MMMLAASSYCLRNLFTKLTVPLWALIVLSLSAADYEVYAVKPSNANWATPPSVEEIEEDGKIRYALRAFGNGLDASHFEFTFLSQGQLRTGDFDIACRAEINAYYVEACAGLIACEARPNENPPPITGLSFGAPYISVFNFPNSFGAPFQHGMQSGGFGEIDREWRKSGQAHWIRLKRQGRLFTTFTGFGPDTNNISWRQIGTRIIGDHRNTPFYVGMFATSESRILPATGHFRDVHELPTDPLPLIEAQPEYEDWLEDRIYLDSIPTDGLSVQVQVYLPSAIATQELASVYVLDQYGVYDLELVSEEYIDSEAPSGKKFLFRSNDPNLMRPKLTGSHDFVAQAYLQNGVNVRFDGQAYIQTMPYDVEWLDYPQGTYNEITPYIRCKLSAPNGISSYKIYFNNVLVDEEEYTRPFQSERIISWLGSNAPPGTNTITIVATNGFETLEFPGGQPVHVKYHGAWHSESRSFTVDVNGPAFIRGSPAQGLYYCRDVVSPYGIYDEEYVQRISLSFDGVTYSRDWGPTFLREGEHHVVEVVEDGAGNRGGGAWSFFIDLTPPVIEIVSPKSGETVPSSAPISVRVTDALAGVKSVVFRLDGEDFIPTPENGLHVISSQGLAHGPHTLEIFANDDTIGPQFYEDECNSSYEAITFFVDAQGPWIRLDGSRTTGLTVPTGARTLYGEVEGDVVILEATGTLPGKELFRSPNLSTQYFTVDFNADTPGEYTLILTAEDALGNTTTKNFVVAVITNIDSDGDLVPDSVDTEPFVADAPPGIVLNQPRDGEFFNKSHQGLVKVSGVVTNDNSVTLIILAEETEVFNTSVEPGPFTFNVPFQDGTYSLRAILVEDSYRTAHSPQRTVIVDTKDPDSIDNRIDSIIALPVWLKGFVKDPSPHATGVVKVQIEGRNALLNAPENADAKFDWMARLTELVSEIPAHVTDRAGNSRALTVYPPAEHAGAKLVMDQERRIAVQEGDTLLIKAFPVQNVGNFKAESILMEGSSIPPPVILHGILSNYYYPYYFTAQCEKGYIPYPLSGTDYSLLFNLFKVEEEEEDEYLGIATGLVDVYRVRMTPSTLVVGGTTGDQPLPPTLPVESEFLKQFFVHQPVRGDIPGLGNCSLKVYAGGKAVGMGDITLWYHPESSGIPSPGSLLVPYTGQPLPVSAIDSGTGKAFYIQGKWKSATANDTAVVLEYDPMRTEGYDYKKICTQVLRITVEDKTARLLVDANHDGQIVKETDVPYQTPRFGALFLRGFDVPNHLDYRARVRVKIELDEGFPGSVTLRSNNEYTGVYLSESAGGPPLITKGEYTWLLPEKPPEFVYVEFPADDQVVLELISGTQKLDELKISVFSNGLGADALSPTATVLPGYATLNLNSGNVHFSAVKETYNTPVLGPGLSYSYNLLDGFDRGNGRGWRSNYDVQIFDGSADENRDETHELVERIHGDLLIVIDESGRRFPFQYDAPKQRFISLSKSGWLNSEIMPPGIEGEYYELMRFDNHRLYHNLNGLLTRVERSDLYELTVLFGQDDSVFAVEDHFNYRTVLVPLPLGPFEMAAQVSGGHLPTIDFVYALSQDPVPIPRMVQATLHGESSGLPAVANGENGLVFIQEGGAATLSLENFELLTNRPQHFSLGGFGMDVLYGENLASTSVYSGGTLSVQFNKYLDAWTSLGTPGGLQISRDIDPNIRRTMIESLGQRIVVSNYDERGYESSRTDNAAPSWTRNYLDIPDDGVHLLITEVINGAGPTSYTYSNKYWIASTTNPENETTSFGYGPPGFLATMTDARGKVWNYSGHTIYGDWQSSVSPMGRPGSRTLLNEYGLLTSTTDWLNYTYSTQYDGRRRVVLNGKPGANASIAYDLFSRVVGSSDYSGTYVLQARDVLGRVTGVVQPGIGARSISYAQTASGIVSVDTREGGRVLSRTTYDFDGRTVLQRIPIVLSPGAAPVNAVTGITYTAEGWPTVVTDPLNNETTTTYDLGARRISVTLPEGGVRSTQYDPVWRVAAVTSPDGETSYTNYDDASRVIESINPANGMVKTNYEGGLVASVEMQADGSSYGLPEFYDYDNDSLPTHKTDRLGLQSVTTYNQNRSVATVHDNALLRSSTAWLDANANVNLITSPLGNTQLAPTADGFVTSITAPNRNPVTQSRDSLNRVTNMALPTGGSSSVQFHPVTGDTLSSTNILSLTTTFNLAPQTGDFNSATDNVEGVPSAPISTVVLRDRNGNVRQFRDAMQRLWKQTFDGNNRRERLISPDNVVTLYTYTPGGKVASVRDTKGTTTVTYQALGLPSEIVDASLRKTTRVYDAFGQLLLETRGSEVSEIEYDSVTKLEKSRRKGSSRVEFFRDRYGRIERLRDSLGHEHVYEFDDADRVVKITYPDGKFETYEYQSNGPDVVAMTDRAGRRTEVTLDGAGRIGQLRHLGPGPAQVVQYGYNFANQVTSETLDGVSLARGYDGRGRLRSVSQPTGGVTYNYLNDDQVETAAAPDGTRQYFYNAAGRLDRMVAPGGEATMAYDAKGRLDTLTLPHGVSRHFTYGQAGRVARMEQTLPGAEGPITEVHTYRYDGEGRLIRAATPSGNYRYAYDAEGRLAEEALVWSTPYSTRYSYDENGNRTAVQRYEQAETKTYNMNGATLPVDSSVQTGDWAVADGFLSSAGAGFVRLNLQPLRDTTTLYQAKLLIVTAGIVEGEERRAGVTFGGNSEGRYGAYISVKLDGGALKQRVRIFHRDAVGVETFVAESGTRDHTDGYWTLEVLVSDVIQARIMQDAQALTLVRTPSDFEISGAVGLEAIGSQGMITVSFDHFRWQAFTAGAQQWNYAYNALNQLLSINGAESATFTYNDMGQQTGRLLNGVQTTYNYDRLGRMTSIAAPGLDQSFNYSGSSWMRQNSTLNGVATSYLYDGHNCVAQTTAGVTTQVAFLGARPLWETSGGVSNTYLDDGQGSVGGLVGVAGLQARFRYDAYGRMKSYLPSGSLTANTSGHRFKGEMYDASSDQVYLRNRQYDPTLGRFTSLDPKGMVDGPNMYAYCGGDPVNRVDPMGTDYVEIGDGQIAHWVVEGPGNSNIIRKVPIGVRNGQNVTIYEGLGGGNISLSALEKKIGYRDFAFSKGTEWDRSITGSLNTSTLIKSSDPKVYLNAMQEQLWLLSGITHREAYQNAKSNGASVMLEQRLLENSPWLGAIRDQPWYIKYPHVYHYSFINTVSGKFLQRQDMNTAAYDLGLKDIDDYVSETRRNAWGGAASATATLAPVGKLQLKSTYSQAPVSGSEWFRKFGERYGAQNVEWAQVPTHAGGKVSGVLVTEVGEVRLLSGYTGPSAAMSPGVVPGMNNILKAHLEAHAASAMRQLNLSEATLYLNKIPCEWGTKNGCLNMLPRMLGEGRRLRVVVPGKMDEVFTGVAP